MRYGKRILALLMAAVLFGNTPYYGMAAGAAEQVESETKENVSAGLSEPKVDGEGSVGELFASAITEQQEETRPQENSENHITELRITGKTAEVRYSTIVDAEIVVAIYDEDTTQMLASGKQRVEAMSGSATVAIETEQMPVTFLASAFLLDAQSHRPLCDTFATQMYTREMQGLLNSGADDYEQDRVLNLDENEETNFAVYNEETKILDADAEANQLTDNGDGSYTIANADDAVKQLKSGDTFSYDYGENNILLIKIDRIETSGDIVTVWESRDAEMTDFFDYLKLEASSEGAQMLVDEDGCDPGVTYLSDQGVQTAAFEGSGSLSHSMSFSLNQKFVNTDKTTVSLKGSFTIDFTVNIDYYIALDYQYFSMITDYAASISVDFSGKLNLINLSCAPVKIPIIPGVTVNLTPSFVAEVSAKIAWKCEFKGTIGSSFTNGEFEDLTEYPKCSSKVDFTGSIFVGLKLAADVAVLAGGAGKAELSGTAGVEAIARKQQPSAAGADTIHDCENCLDGDLNVKVSVAFKVSFLGGFYEWEEKLAELKIKISDFYLSFTYGGEFGWTTCPHASYKVTAAAKSKLTGKPLEDVTITVVDQETGENVALVNPSCDEPPKTTDEDGKLEFYLPNGLYGVKAIGSGISGENTLKVRGKKASVKLQLAETYGTVRLTAVDEDGTPVPDAEIEGTTLPDAPLTGQDGVAEFVLPTGDYSLRVSAGELSGYCKLTVEKDETKELTVQMNRKHLLHLNVVDEDGDPVEYARVSGLDLPEEPITDEHGDVELYVMPGDINLQIYKRDPDNIADCYFGAYYGTIGTNDEPLEVEVKQGIRMFWTLNGGVFRFFGEGDPTDDIVGDIVWWEDALRDKIEKIIVEDGITGIYDFRDCTNLKEAEIAKSVTAIHVGTFEDCTSLKSVKLSAGLRYLDNSAFSGCTSLREIELPAGLRTIESGAFYGCTSLEQITIPSSVTEIQWRAFENCTNLVTAAINGAVTIGDRAFANCEKLYFVTLPPKLEEIGESAFESTAIPDVKLPETLKRINEYAFYDCKELREIEIPKSATQIGGGAFRSCEKLASVTMHGDLEHPIVDEDGGFISEGKGIFANCTSLTEVSLSSELSTIAAEMFSGCKSLPSITIPNHVQEIGAGAFEGCEKLASVEMSNSVTKIGGGAFRYCRGLQTVELSDALTEIGEYAFGDCTTLPEIDIPDGVTKISVSMFSDCHGLSTVHLSENTTSIGDAAFSDCWELAEINFPDEITLIGHAAFVNCCSLPSHIVLPKKLKYLLESAFAISDEVSYDPDLYRYDPDRTNLNRIDLPEGLEEILGGVFYGRRGLTQLVIPASVKRIPQYNFIANSGIENVYFKGDKPEGLTSSTLSNGSQYDENGDPIVNVRGYYPAGNSTWNDLDLDSDHIRWMPYNPASLTAAVSEPTDGSDDALPTGQPSYAYEVGIDLTDGTVQSETSGAVGKTAEDGAVDSGSAEAETPAVAEDVIIEEDVLTDDGTGGTGETEETDKAADPSVAEIPADDSADAVITEESTLEVFAEGEASLSTHRAQFADLVANASYVFAAVRNAEADDLLAPSNLLYITQATADTDGNLSLDYVPVEDIEGVVKVFGETHKNLDDAEITVSEMTANGSVQFPNVTVVYDGAELEEDQDYRLSGDVRILDGGTYSLTVTGINEYSGSVTVAFEVKITQITHVHTFEAPNFIWSSDCSNCRVVLNCVDCSETQDIDCQITSTALSPACLGTRYTATAEFEGKVYTDSRTIAGRHSYGDWKTLTAATVFLAKTESRKCNVCGRLELRTVGKKLDPTIRLNATNIPLRKKQATTKLKVNGLAAGDSVVSWKSSNPKIVTVSSSGKIRAKNKTGKATITVTLASGKTAKVTVKVQKAAVKTKKIKGLPKKLNIKKKAKVKLAPEITPITSLQKVTYKTSNRKVATVNKKGVVVAKGKGTAKITVKSGKKSFKITVKVTK